MRTDLSIPSIARSGNWWNSKIPPVFGLAFGAALVYRVSAWETLAYVVSILTTGMCAGAYGHLINDIFDLEADRKAGKKNVLSSFSPWQRWAFVVITIVGGFLPAWVLHFSSISTGLLVAEYALPSIYSIPPFRLKERGWLGVLADASGAHIVPCLFVTSLMAYAPSATRDFSAASFESMFYPAAAVLWATAVGLKGIIMHELGDLESDLSAGVRTFAAQLDFARIKRGALMLFRIEIALFFLFCLVLSRLAPLVLLSALGFLLLTRVKVREAPHVFGRDKVGKLLMPLVWTSNPYYETYFAVAMGIHLGIRNPALLPIPVLLPLLFRDNWKDAWKDLRSAWMLWNVSRSWNGRLSTMGAASVRLRRLGGQDATRVEFDICGVKPEAVILFRNGRPVKARQAMEVSLRARADKPRTIVVGVSQGDEPWGSLGLNQRIRLTREWQNYDFQFWATEADPAARCGVFLGGSPVAVELANLEMSESDVRWDGSLVASEFAVARLGSLNPATSQSGGIRVNIAVPGDNPWDLALFGSEVKVLGGSTVCEMSVTGRTAGASRSAIVGVWGNKPPWQACGIYERVEFTSTWSTHRFVFKVEPPPGQRALPGVWLGGDSTPVELREFVVKPVWNGDFVTSGDAAARIEPMSDESNGVRIVIDSQGQEPWQIGIYGPSQPISAGGSVVEWKFTARAAGTSNRFVVAGIWQDHDPWDSLGQMQRLELSATEWQTFHISCQATRAETSARAGLWLGGASGDIEIRELSAFTTHSISLSLGADASARIVYRDQGSFRVDIDHPGEEAWHVAAYESPRSLRVGDPVSILLRARADAKRRMIVGAWQNHEPWECADFFQEVELRNEIDTFSWTFTPASSDDSVRFGIWAGGQESGIDVEEFAVFEAWQGTLAVSDGARAVLQPAADPDCWRIAIEAPGSQEWAISLFRPAISVVKGAQYRIRLTVRADQARNAVLGAWQDHEPWDPAGTLNRVTLRTEWTSFEMLVVPTLAHTSLRCGLWMGGEAPAVEVSHLEMLPEPGE